MSLTAQPARQPLWWWLTALLAALIWGLSSRPATPLPTPHPLDWLAHFAAYAALGYSLGRASGNWTLAWVVAAWFGAVDEVHQAFVPPREAGIADWWFDLAGAALGARWAAGSIQPRYQVDLEFDESDDVPVLSEPPR